MVNLQEKWLKRAEAVDRLDAVVEEVRQYCSTHPTAMFSSSSEKQTSSSSSTSSLQETGGTITREAQGSLAISNGSSSAETAWQAKMDYLESAINDAKASNISVSKVSLAILWLPCHENKDGKHSVGSYLYRHLQLWTHVTLCTGREMGHRWNLIALSVPRHQVHI